MRPFHASSFPTSSASRWSVIQIWTSLFWNSFKVGEPEPKMPLGMCTRQNTPSYLPPSWFGHCCFCCHHMKTSRATALLFILMIPFWTRAVVQLRQAGSRMEEPHPAQIFLMASRAVFTWVLLFWASCQAYPLFLMSTVSSPIPVLGTVRAHGPSWMALEASGQPESQDSPSKTETLVSNPGRLRGHPRASSHSPARSRLSSLRGMMPSGHRVGARGTCSPPATS